MTNIAISRRLGAEFLGTAFLLATIAGSGIMGESLAGGQTGLALLPHSLAIGAMLFVLLTLFGPISGAHFNPAVTLVILLRREIGPWEAALYSVMQVTGAIVGIWAAHLMFDREILQASTKIRSGTGQWSAELFATFGLVFVILAGLQVARKIVPALVGLYIMSGLWFAASTSFANPAVTIARAMTDTFSGIAPADAPAFVAMQLVGASLALAAVGFFFPSRR